MGLEKVNPDPEEVYRRRIEKLALDGMLPRKIRPLHNPPETAQAVERREQIIDTAVHYVAGRKVQNGLTDRDPYKPSRSILDSAMKTVAENKASIESNDHRVVANKVEDLYDARVSERDTALEAFARDLEAIFHQYLAYEEQD